MILITQPSNNGPNFGLAPHWAFAQLFQEVGVYAMIRDGQMDAITSTPPHANEARNKKWWNTLFMFFVVHVWPACSGKRGQEGNNFDSFSDANANPNSITALLWVVNLALSPLFADVKCITEPPPTRFCLTRACHLLHT
mmetsp:Transcript_140494/g.244589  ORF Transcript_140494/g.244589 Transcript_140494/m.244589 type:complete len:139 (-) Transcript_140494:89-505(-)